MILGIVGDEGSGKSLLTVTLAIVNILAEPSIDIISNIKSFKYTDYDFDNNFIPIINLIRKDKRLLEYKRLVLVDEIDKYMDNRQSMSHNNIEISHKLVQIRKYRMHLIYTAVSWDMLDLRLRKTTNAIISCLGYDSDTSVIEYEVLNKFGEYISRNKRININKSVYNLYDTFEDIENNIDLVTNKKTKSGNKIDLDKLTSVEFN
jgi:ABC-type dipeptide/oligopeptide/nickel transport system ATPase component